MDQHKRTVLVTGASRGIGKIIAEQFNQLGHRVITPTRDELDLSNLQSVKSFVSSFDEEISVLVNNAGLNIVEKLDAYSDVDLEIMVNTNLLSVVKLSRMAAISPRLTSICNIASVWSEKSFPGRAVYSMTKSGILGLTRGLAQELGHRNILVNAVSPGFIETEMTKANITPERRAELYKNIPLGRFGQPRDIAKVVTFLCSDENRYITGQNIIADGGFLS